MQHCHVVPSRQHQRLLEDGRVDVGGWGIGNRMTNVVLITLSHQPVARGEDSMSTGAVI